MQLRKKVHDCRALLHQKSRALSSVKTEKSPLECNIKLPKLKILNFCDNSKDLLAFDSFRATFMNAMSSFSEITDVTKLIYLESLLGGRALSLIEHLPVNEYAFDEAWKLLEDEFLDKDFLVNSILSELINWPSCGNLTITMEFSTFLKSKLLSLRRVGFYFEERNTPGNVLLCNLVRAKLPAFFMQEICRRSGEGYQSVNDFSDFANDICRMFKKGKV